MVIAGTVALIASVGTLSGMFWLIARMPDGGPASKRRLDA